MADVEKTGDWDGFAKMLAEAGAKFKQNIQKATNDSGHLLEDKIVDRIKTNAVQPPTGAAFKKWKEAHGYSDTTLVMSHSLMDNVKYDPKDWNEGFVGVNRNAEQKSPDGKSTPLISIAAVMEFGTLDGKIQPRPYIAPVVEQETPKIIENYQKAIDKTFKK